LSEKNSAAVVRAGASSSPNARKIRIISIKSESDESLRRVELSDGSIFSFKTCYLPPVFNTAEGIEISETEEESLRFASACLRAEKAALRLIARAEQTCLGLTRKLEKRGHDSACVRSVISQLCESALLDDRRYARLWLDARLSRQRTSPRRLLIALSARGIDRDDTSFALKEALDDEAEFLLLKRYVDKLQHKKKISNDDNGARSLKYLLKSEGFSSFAIQRFFVE
jgi:regulatory protein